jgi:hypothetical protein
LYHTFIIADKKHSVNAKASNRREKKNPPQSLRRILFLVQGYLIKALAVENGIALEARFL